MDLDQMPEEQKKENMDRAKQDANAPIFVSTDWFKAAGHYPETATLVGEAPLFRFDACRRRAAGRLGFTTSGSAIENAAGWVFLCLVPREEIDPARGSRWINGVYVDTESAFRQRSEEWEDAIGARLGKGNEATRRITEIANELWLREEASAGEPVLPKGRVSENPNG